MKYQKNIDDLKMISVYVSKKDLDALNKNNINKSELIRDLIKRFIIKNDLK